MKLFELFEDMNHHSPAGDYPLPDWKQSVAQQSNIVRNTYDPKFDKYWIDTNTKTMYAVDLRYHWYYVVKHPELFTNIPLDQPNPLFNLPGRYEENEHGDVRWVTGSESSYIEYIKFYENKCDTDDLDMVLNTTKIDDYPHESIDLLLKAGYVRTYIHKYNEISFETKNLKFAHIAASLIKKYTDEINESTSLSIDGAPGGYQTLSGRRLAMFLKTGNIPSRMVEKKKVKKKAV